MPLSRDEWGYRSLGCMYFSAKGGDTENVGVAVLTWKQIWGKKLFQVAL